MVDEFTRLMQGRGQVEADEDVLGDAVAFAGVAKYPARVKCALLSWMAYKDARGEECLSMSKPTETPTAALMTATCPTTRRVMEALKDVVDPELGINVVDLGLIYGLNLDAAGEASSRSRRST